MAAASGCNSTSVTFKKSSAAQANVVLPSPAVRTARIATHPDKEERILAALMAGPPVTGLQASEIVTGIVRQPAAMRQVCVFVAGTATPCAVVGNGTTGDARRHAERACYVTGPMTGAYRASSVEQLPEALPEDKRQDDGRAD